MTKYIVIIFILLISLNLFGEKNEFQFFTGSGLYIPFSEGSSLINGRANFPLEVEFGLTENLWVGLNLSYVYLNNYKKENHIYDKSGYKGDLWFNFHRVHIGTLFKYNLLRGYTTSPNAVLGIGAVINNYNSHRLYLPYQQKWHSDYKKADYWNADINFQAGFDAIYRAWWNSLIKVGFLYNYAPFSNTNSHGIEINLTIGYSHFFNSYDIY